MSAPQFSNTIIRGLSPLDCPREVAMMAGYSAAETNRQYNPATRLGTNPNSTFAYFQRTRLSLEGELAVKNTPFGVNYLFKRIIYCSAGMQYSPDTGDASLDAEILEVCSALWENMGIDCSMQEAYTRVADVFLPQSGDSALQWYRDEDCLRLLEITADRIGEQYAYALPKQMPDGETYFAGLFARGPMRTGYRIYDRYSEATYVNPHRVDPWDIIFFKDDISGGLRGVSKFFAALESVRKNSKILQYTMDTMQQQSKIAAIASNNAGGPLEYTYSQVDNNQQVEYVEQFADGAVVKYQFNGDSYQVLKAEHPTEAFLGGLRYGDEQSSLAMGFPYGFLYSGSGTGGAPFRGDFEVAGKELTRLRYRVHTPRLKKISYVTIMDAVERGLLPPHPNITRGSWEFNSLPSVDSFRDDKSDILSVRAGLADPDKIIRRNGDGSAEEVLRGKKDFAVIAARMVEEGNKELVAMGCKPSLTINDIMQTSDNPQQASVSEKIEKGEVTVKKPEQVGAGAA